MLANAAFYVLFLIALAGAASATVPDCRERSACSPAIVGAPDVQPLARDVAIRDDHAFVAGMSGGFSVYSLIQPTQPVHLLTETFVDSARKIVLHGDRAFVFDTFDRAGIWDISDPLTPTRITVLYHDPELTDLAVHGDQAYTLSVGGGRCILGRADLTDLSGLVHTTPIDTIPASVYLEHGSLAVVDEVLYLGTNGIRTYDLTNPLEPALMDEIPLGGTGCSDFDRDGTRGYFLTNLGVTAVDLAQPADLWSNTTSLEVAAATSLACADGMLYVGMEDGRVLYYDVSDPAQPVHVDTAFLRSEVYDLDVHRGYLYASLHFHGFFVLALQAAADCAPLATVALDTTAYDLVENDGWLHVAGRDGIRTLDFSIPSAPVPTGWLPSDAGLLAIESAGDLLFAGGTNGLRIAAGAGTAEPAWIGSLPRPWINDVEPVGNICWLAVGSPPRIYAADVTDPTAPVEVGSLAFSASPLTIRPYGDDRLLAVTPHEAVVLDVSDPAAPVRVETITGFNQSADLYVLGSRFFVAGYFAGVRIYDMSDPAAVEDLGTVRFPGVEGIRHVGATANTVYATTTTGHLFVADITDPSAPIVIGQQSIEGSSSSLSITGEHVLVTTLDGRLLAWPRHCDYSHLPAPQLYCQEQPGQRLFYWSRPEDAMYLETCLYRGTRTGFEPDEPLACNADGHFYETDLAHRFYLVRHRDVEGFWSPPSNEIELAGAAPVPDPGRRVRLTVAPNPFNPATGIRYALPRESDVLLEIHDLRGRRVLQRKWPRREPGVYTFRWHGRDGSGRDLPAGSYLLRVQLGDRVETRKLTLLK